jgi:quinol monooxygenase YgiN
MNGKVILVTALPLKPEFEELLLSELAPIIEASREFAGCLSFDLYRLSKNRNTLVLQETWKTQEACQAYALSPLRGELTGLFARALAVPIETWQVEEVCCSL